MPLGRGKKNLINVMSCICSPGLGHFQPASSPVACLPTPHAFPSLIPSVTRALGKQRGALHRLLGLPGCGHRAVCWAGAEQGLRASLRGETFIPGRGCAGRGGDSRFGDTVGSRSWSR